MIKLHKNIFLLSLFASSAYASHQPTSYPLYEAIKQHQVIRQNDINKVRQLLADETTDVNLQDTDGHAPLMFAVVIDNTEIVKLLLDHPKIDVNVKNNEKRTALSYLRANLIRGSMYIIDHLSGAVNLVKNTQIPSLHKDHDLLKPNYLNSVFRTSCNNDHNQDLKQYIDILLINKIHNSLQKTQRPTLYQACCDVYAPKNRQKLLKWYDWQIDQNSGGKSDLIVHGILRMIGIDPFGQKCPSDLLKIIGRYSFATRRDTYPGFLQIANHTQDRFLFEVIKQEENYQAVATKNFASGLAKHGIIQDATKVYNRPISMIISLLLAGLKSLQ